MRYTIQYGNNGRSIIETRHQHLLNTCDILACEALAEALENWLAPGDELLERHSWECVQLAEIERQLAEMEVA